MPEPDSFLQRLPRDDAGNYRLGKYRLGRKLGEGGMGAVFAAKTQVGSLCAIKVVTRFERGVEERFKREAEAMSRVVSNHVVGIQDFGSDGGVSYIVMDYVDGRSAQDLLVEALRAGRVLTAI